MGRVDGKVALITGVARGQGRAHALRLAEEGASIVGFDALTQFDSAPYPMPVDDDLAETERLVTERGGRIVTRVADVRDLDQVQGMVDLAFDEYGRLDTVVANAGICGFGKAWELDKSAWDEMIDVNLTGVWNTLRASVPRIIEQDQGGSLILTASVAGFSGMRNVSHYVAAKHGVVGLMRAYSNEVAPHNIRVNAICPTTVDTDLIHNPYFYSLFVPGVENPTREQAGQALMANKPFNTPWVETVDIANAALFLASDEARYITGVLLPVLGGPV
ncbi:mycofactocin-coupled SDR family oxidoreductase [Nocardioides humi]|uniref:Mycofactocin-coupled SDR family oxidoreductase n=1 Tax=Nocardioides humi TaxID=449461 RepID=A0ABN2ADZ7_9ACTN|nr:mycofactocin-coupled SDR family oxidoreductase [Nocardioides humi]